MATLPFDYTSIGRFSPRACFAIAWAASSRSTTMDSPEAVALVLFLPLLLAPLFALVKWVLLSLPLGKRPPLRFVLAVAVSESFLPLASVAVVLTGAQALNAAGVPDHLLPRAPAFLVLLAGFSFALNLACLLRWHPRPGVRTAALALAAGQCTAFAIAWFGVIAWAHG